MLADQQKALRQVVGWLSGGYDKPNGDEVALLKQYLDGLAPNQRIDILASDGLRTIRSLRGTRQRPLYEHQYLNELEKLLRQMAAQHEKELREQYEYYRDEPIVIINNITVSGMITLGVAKGLDRAREWVEQHNKRPGANWDESGLNYNAPETQFHDDDNPANPYKHSIYGYTLSIAEVLKPNRLLPELQNKD